MKAPRQTSLLLIGILPLLLQVSCTVQIEAAIDRKVNPKIANLRRNIREVDDRVRGQSRLVADLCDDHAKFSMRLHEHEHRGDCNPSGGSRVALESTAPLALRLMAIIAIIALGILARARRPRRIRHLDINVRACPTCGVRYRIWGYQAQIQIKCRNCGNQITFT